jgi:hypothetical protein
VRSAGRGVLDFLDLGDEELGFFRLVGVQWKWGSVEGNMYVSVCDYPFGGGIVF